jgi:glycosyltransferase involved in cell wall biosynthesis
VLDGLLFLYLDIEVPRFAEVQLRLRICYVVPDVAVPYHRGASTHVYELSRELVSRGNSVFVVSRRLNRSQLKLENVDGFRTYRTFQGLAFEPPGSSYSSRHVDRDRLSRTQRIYGWYLGSYRALQLGVEIAAVLRGNSIDVVLERETAFGAGAVVSIILSVPLVLEVVGPRISPLSLKRASRILTYSERMIGGRAPRQRLRIVSGAVNTELFTPDPRLGEGVRRGYELGDSPVIGYIGTFPHWHGVEGLLAATKKVMVRIPRVKLLLVGPYFDGARELSTRLGIEGRVVFTGPVPYESVPAYINACDVLSAPYNPSLSRIRSEQGIGAPLKLLEYMACQKPVVSTTVGPIPEVVADGKTGLLVPPGDEDGLAGALIRLLEDRHLAESLAQEARRLVVSRYSWENLAKTLEKELAEAVHDAARSERNSG